MTSVIVFIIVVAIVTCVAPASIEFSTSSFTIEEGLSTTSPAAILLNRLGSN